MASSGHGTQVDPETASMSFRKYYSEYLYITDSVHRVASVDKQVHSFYA